MHMKRPALPPGSAPSRVRRAVLSCLMIWGLAPLPAYLGAQADNPDSLVRLLTSPSVGVRADAVVRLSLIPMAQLPVAARPALVSLLEREATGQVAYPDTTARYETDGEYIIDLTRTVLRFHDPASVRGLSLLGIQTSRAAQEFVASLGSQSLAALDEAWTTKRSARPSVLVTLGRMLAPQQVNGLSESDRQGVLKRIWAGADSFPIALATTARAASLFILVPVLRHITSSDSDPSVGASVGRALAELQPKLDATPPATVGSGLNDWLQALCLAAQSARSSACTSLSGSLSSARGQITTNQPGPARDTLMAFGARVDTGFQQGVCTDGEHRLLAANARYLGFRLGSAIFFHGIGGNANPTLALSTVAPAGTTAKYQDSPALAFANGDPWVAVGTWTSLPGLGSGILSALGAAQVWLGLKNSDDIGTNFDLRVEAYKNGTLVAAGQTLCVQGITRNADLAKAVTVAFPPFTATTFDGVADVLSLKVLTRIGTTATGAACGGHSNAVGLRLYFDAVSRKAQFAATF